MSEPTIPAPEETLAERPFSFYPAIVNIEHNEWRYLKSSWSELLVENTGDQRQLWVPRRYLGEISSVDEPVMIVGLVKELSYQGGALWPADRRVVTMPPPVMAERPSAPLPEPPPKPALGFDKDESKIGKLIGLVLVGAIALCLFVITVFRGHEGGRVSFRTVEQAELGLTARDDYFAVVRKLGEPRGDRWRAGKGEIQYRELDYPDWKVHVILMGTERERVLYIGALDEQWRPVHSVELPGGGNSGSILRGLPRF
jgi:hypothetical protein